MKNSFLKTVAVGLIIWGSIFVTGCAMQNDMVMFEERLIALERQAEQSKRAAETMRQKTFEQEQGTQKDLRTQYASLNVGLDALQQDLRRLNGRIEEIDHAMSSKSSDGGDVGKRIDDVNFALAKIDQRLTQIEQYLNFEKTAPAAVMNAPQAQQPQAAQPQPAPGPAAAPAPAAPASDSDTQLYNTAKQAYDNGQWEKARQGFQQLLESYPKSEHADNAQFWIGESYYREKWYEKAILEYQTVIEKYSKGNKVAAAMLKQGLAFLQLGDKSNARLILKELEKKYPQSNEASIAVQKLKEF